MSSVRRPTQPTPPVIVVEKSKNDTLMGAPKAALKIIIINMVVVSLLLALLYLLDGGDVRVIPTLAFTVLGLALFQLAIQFIFWKLYWWLLGMAWSCLTFILVAGVIGVVTGALSLDRLSTFQTLGF